MSDKIDWPMVLLNDNGIRPAGPADACFYCNQKVGQLHLLDCVSIRKRVKVRYTVEVEIDMPHSAGKAEIEYNRNDGRWCGNNVIDDITEHIDSTGYCLCNNVKCEYLGDVDGKFIHDTHTDDEMRAMEAIRLAISRTN